MMRKWILLLLLVLITGGLGALEVKQGKVKLILHEGLGRFSLYTLVEDEYIPLFVDQDPRTTKVVLVMDNKIVTLGETAEFQETVEETENGARFLWNSNILTITQDFTFVSSQSGAEADGVRINFSFVNNSDREISVGIRFCIDTYLEEDKFLHFTTNKQQEVVRETTVTAENMIQYWTSPSSEAATALECQTSGGGVTIPDKIVFANWKRLNDAPWTYETVDTRNFNNLPYSINDSAVCHFYEPQILKRMETRKIVSIMGDFGGQSDFTSPVSEKAVEKGEGEVSRAEVKPSEGKQVEPSFLRSEINRIDVLLQEIDTQLSGRTTAEEIQALERTLAEVKSKVEQFITDR